MQARVAILLLLGIWSAGVAAAAGVSGNEAGKRNLTLTFPKLTPELLQALQDASVSPEQLKSLQEFLMHSFQGAVHQWMERFQIAMNTLLKPEDNADDVDMQDFDFGERDESNQDKIRRILREGWESKGIPPLDPFEYDHVPVVFTVPNVIDVDGQLDNITFSGLSNFDADVPIPKLNINVVNVVFDVFEKLLEIASQYRLDAHAEALDIWGKGNISIKFFSLNVNGQVRVRITLLSAAIDPCFINLSIRKAKVEITGLFGGGVLTQLIGEVFTDLVNENLETVTSFVAQTAEDGICGYLRSKSRKELIQLWLDLQEKINKN